MHAYYIGIVIQMPDRRNMLDEKNKKTAVSNKLLYVLENNVCYFLGFDKIDLLSTDI